MAARASSLKTLIKNWYEPAGKSLRCVECWEGRIDEIWENSYSDLRYGWGCVCWSWMVRRATGEGSREFSFPPATK